MLTLVDTPEELEKLADDSRKILDSILEGAKIDEDGISVGAETVFIEDGSTLDNRLYYINDGVFKLFCFGKMVRIYENGDLLGLEQLFGMSGYKIRSEFGSTLTAYNSDKLWKFLRKKKKFFLWQEYVAQQIYLSNMITALHIGESVRPEISVRKYEPGQTIIEEGTDPDEIFEMMRGEADVYVKGNVVGSITDGEVFGEISFLVGEPRSATVKAKDDCMVTVVKGSEFELLAKHQPKMVLKMASGLANRVVNLNRLVTHYS